MVQNNRYTSPAVLNLLIINALVFMATEMLPQGNALMLKLSIYLPASSDFHIYQIVTHMFTHVDIWHIFSNMFALWMFGRVVEYDLGTKRLLLYYFVCGLGAALIQMGVNWMEINSYLNSGELVSAADAINAPMLGASGAVFGILLAFGMMRPNAMIMLMLPPIPMKAKYFVILYGLLELWVGVRGGGDGVAHFAHIGGMLWGLLLILWWRKRGKI